MKLPPPAPQLADLLNSRQVDVEGVLQLGIGPEVGGVYEHWDRLRHLEPPHGLSSEGWWTALKLARRSLARPLPLNDKSGKPFTVSITGTMHRKLHFLDREAAGAIQAAALVDDQTARKHYLMRSLIEEAMTSSQLEGASTTRRVAKELLSTGRAPRDRSEQMIFNNYAMMQSLRSLGDQALSVELILKMHRLLMVDALDDPGQAGRLRTAEDNVVIQDRADPTITLHVPPPAAELPERLQALCDFANGGDSGEFLHPIVRAIAIHFQIGYDHPFCDGNGRTARALFYWSMLRSGYWLSEYVSISSVLKKAPQQYVRAYLHTESDGTDLSYFVAHQLDVIIAAVEGLRGYLARKGRERNQAEALLRPGSPLGARLNHRQRSILLHAIRHPDSVYEIAGHQAAHRVTYPTARADLLGLVELDLLRQDRRGKAFIFLPARDLAQRLDV
ncbi:Fic family protein [Lysobacter spongiicola DSM 21749]|uniref:Fic family protein n=1 Tax=Lysobacter spongiicola DSM 21749 TaxID=1122188 RepID=A0A1T4RJ16_9GAMM|nr:Fic family protein [Lysobacter spongiicola DSM 21749]